MSNVLSMAERETIAALLRQDWSKRRIAKELGLHRDTVRRYACELKMDGTQRPAGEPTPVPAIAGEVAIGPDSKQATSSEVATGNGEAPNAVQG